MSTSTTIYVGAFLICKMSKTTEVVDEKKCSGNPAHRFYEEDEFCPKCGSKITTKKNRIQRQRSFYTEVIDRIDDKMTRPQKYVRSKFEHVPNEFVGYGRTDAEILVPLNTMTIDADREGIARWSPKNIKEMFQPVSEENMMMLVEAVGYELITPQYGALVMIA